MHLFYIILAICLATSEALPQHGRIVGGAVTTISHYPFAAVLLVQSRNTFRQDCGGSILNNRSILSAAHCWVETSRPARVRVGSTNASSGGALLHIANLIAHPQYNVGSHNNNDIGIVRVATAIVFGNNVRAVAIPGSNFHIADNQNVWAIGWGLTSWGGNLSEQLRHVQLRIVNQARCQSVYGPMINANKICAGWDTNGRGTCTGDSGGPLLHNNVVIGITSFGIGCAEARHPDVYARVSRYTHWIRSNA